jgi:hypothetical protein
MPKGVEIPKAEAQKARQLLELERKYAPHRRANALVSWLVFILALAVAAAIVYYAFFNKEQFARLWHRATNPDSVPAEVQPGQ